MTQDSVRDSEEAYAGKDLGAMDFEVTEELLGHYFEGLDVDRVPYEEQSPYGKPLAPSMILTNVDTGFSGSRASHAPAHIR